LARRETTNKTRLGSAPQRSPAPKHTREGKEAVDRLLQGKTEPAKNSAVIKNTRDIREETGGWPLRGALSWFANKGSRGLAKKKSQSARGEIKLHTS